MEEFGAGQNILGFSFHGFCSLCSGVTDASVIDACILAKSPLSSVWGGNWSGADTIMVSHFFAVTIGVELCEA